MSRGLISLVEDCHCEGEDDFFNDCSPTVNHFDLVVGHLEDILVDNSFMKLQQDFLDEYCDHFENTEENKLEYMEIFEKYVCILEKNIEGRLKQTVPNFDLDRLYSELKENREVLDGEVFEMLYTLSDFSAFKSLILDYKAGKHGQNEDFASTLTVVPLRIK